MISHKQEFKRWLGWVETQLDLIHAAGRDEYLQNDPSNFRRFFRNYKEAGGFDRWKNENREMLDLPCGRIGSLSPEKA